VFSDDLDGSFSAIDARVGLPALLSLHEISIAARVLGFGAARLRPGVAIDCNSWQPLRVALYPKLHSGKFNDPLPILPAIRRPKFPALREQFGPCYAALLKRPLSAIEFRNFAMSAESLFAPKFVQFFELMREKLACHRMKELTKMLTAKQLIARFSLALTNARRFREELLEEVARRFEFGGPEFVARRTLLTFATVGSAEVDQLAKDSVAKCTAEGGVSRAEARLAVDLNQALARRPMGEAIIAVVKVVTLVGDVFGEEREKALWRIVCRSRKEALVRLVLTFVKWLWRIDCSLQFNEEVIAVMRMLAGCLETHVFTDNPELFDRFQATFVGGL
jgi:hypothetical protein